MRQASLFSLAVGIALSVMKLGVWSFTDSLSVLASMFDSFFDVMASLVNLLAIHFSLQPPDDEHRFGHGKIEDIAAFAQAAFIAGSGLFICIEGVKRLFFPEMVSHGAWGIAVMVVSIGLTLALVMFQRRVVSHTDSIAVRSDSFHYLTDLLGNAAVIVALVLASWLGVGWADPLFALLIAAYIFYGAWHIGQHAFQNLIDREFADSEREKILAVCRDHPEVRGVHELKTRRSGIYNFIQCHLVFDEDMSLRRAHLISDEVEVKLKELFPNLEVIIHQDPYGDE